MPTYAIALDDGREFEIDAPDEQALKVAVEKLRGPSQMIPGSPLAQAEGLAPVTAPEGGDFAAGVASSVPQNVRGFMPGSKEAELLSAQEAVRSQRSPLAFGGGKAFGALAPALLAPSTAGMAFLPRVGAEMTMAAAQSAPRDRGDIVGSAATAGGLTSLFGVAGKGVNAVRQFLGNPVAAERMALEKAAWLEGLLTQGELRGSPSLQKTEANLERIPLVGTMANQERRVKMLEERAGQMRDTQGGDFGDIGTELQASLARVEQANSGKAAELYDAVAKATKDSKFKVSMRETKAAAEAALKKATQNADLKGEGEFASVLRRYATAAPRSFEDARALRSDLLADIRQIEAKVANGAANKRDAEALYALQASLERDIQRFADGVGGETKALYRKAQDYYRENVAPFKERDIRKALGAEDTDPLFAQFIKKNRVQLAQKLGGRLDERGRQALKYGVLDSAYEAASQGERFNPIVFRNEIRKLGKTTSALFSPDELKAVEGYNKLVTYARGVGDFAANPKTGIQAVDVGTGIGAGMALAHNPIAAGATLGATKFLGSLLTDPRARALLNRAADAPEGSKTMDYVRRELAKLMIRGSAQQQQQQNR